MTINKYFVFAPQASEDTAHHVATDKEAMRREALKQAQAQGGMETNSDC